MYSLILNRRGYFQIFTGLKNLPNRLLYSKYYSIIYDKMSCTWTKCSDERHLLEPRELLRIQEYYSTYMNECNEL